MSGAPFWAVGVGPGREQTIVLLNRRGFATRTIHAGQSPDPSTGAVMPPIYATSTYAQSSPGVSHTRIEDTPRKLGSPSFAAYGYRLKLKHEETGKEVGVDEKGYARVSGENGREVDEELRRLGVGLELEWAGTKHTLRPRHGAGLHGGDVRHLRHRL